MSMTWLKALGYEKNNGFLDRELWFLDAFLIVLNFRIQS
jgi:hypothetical protein